jgi:hypothetical protein
MRSMRFVYIPLICFAFMACNEDGPAEPGAEKEPTAEKKEGTEKAPPEEKPDEKAPPEENAPPPVEKKGKKPAKKTMVPPPAEEEPEKAPPPPPPPPAPKASADKDCECGGGDAAAANAEPPWKTKLRDACYSMSRRRVKRPNATSTAGWWKDKVDLQVKDLRVYSPFFRKWSLLKVDNPDKSTSVRHSGPYFGYGLTVEVTNKSQQVLENDAIYVWAEFKSRTGKRGCFAVSNDDRSWNPLVKKRRSDVRGGWIKEREYSEAPMRPGERKRYTISNNACFSSMFLETDPTDVKIEVFFRFWPVGSGLVVMGPMETYNRPAQMLRGVPLAGASRTMQLVSRKKVTPIRAWYMAGDHFLALEDKKARWIPWVSTKGSGGLNLPKLGAWPKTTPAYEKTFGAVTLKISGWRFSSWHKMDGKLKQGHKLLSAKVDLSVDTSSVTQQLEGTVNAANTKLTEAQTDLSVKQAAADGAKAAYDAAKGTEGADAAKDKMKETKADLKLSKKNIKAAQKTAKAAQKAMGGGVTAFLKNALKAVDCGSFRVDVGRKQLRPAKGSLDKKGCKPLLGGQSVSGYLMFDLERWDLPFILSWKGMGGGLQAIPLASEALATIPRR